MDALRQQVIATGVPIMDFATYVSVKYETLRGWMYGSSTPRGLKALKRRKEANGWSWDEAMRDSQRRRGVDEPDGIRALRRVRRALGCSFDDLLRGF